MPKGSGTIFAAGGVVERPSGQGVQVLLVHRTRYRDDEWSLPKGKSNPGESLEQTAVREVREETGCTVSVAEFLGVIRYRVKDRPKEVHFWRMTLVQQNEREDTREVQDLRWLPPAEALPMLSYEGEREVLARAYGLPSGESA